jgi:hypothetical protein
MGKPGSVQEVRGSDTYAAGIGKLFSPTSMNYGPWSRMVENPQLPIVPREDSPSGCPEFALVLSDHLQRLKSKASQGHDKGRIY